MYFAPVTPPQLVPHLPRSVRSHLVIANEVLASPGYYTELRNGNSVARTRVIVDNPVHEGGRILSIEKRIAIAQMLEANLVVAPDIIGDPIKSQQLLENHMRTKLARSFETMAVAQGTNHEQLASHLEQIAQLGVTNIAIPQIRVKYSSHDRYAFVCSLQGQGFFDRYPNTKLHLLGNIDLFEDAMLLRPLPAIIGIDSAKPIYLAMYGVGIDIRDVEAARNTHRPKGYFSLAPDQVDIDLMQWNIQTVQEWVGDS